MEIILLLCGLLFLIGVLGLGAVVLLVKLGVAIQYWKAPDTDTIDAEYTIEQQQDID